LKRGHVVECDRSKLVAEYVGQTAVKTNKVIDEALDGILFIDEAYSLAQGVKEDYGKEAIETLLKRMEDSRDRLIVIVAGYTNEMRRFIAANPGLQSRFTSYIEFPDYSDAECCKIFETMATQNGMTCSEGLRRRLNRRFEEERARQEHYGNARYARNLFEETLNKQASRLAQHSELSPELLSHLQEDDLP
jgi:SpoVK/Ycf46/Vps4 family AAA+-type ATPase